MHIIFGALTSWQIPMLRLFRFLKFKVFYLFIATNSNLKKNKIAEKLKKKNILPLPMELQNKILPEASFFLCDCDPVEIAYKRNVKLIPEQILKKYCNLFTIKDGKTKKLRILLQDIFAEQIYELGKLDVWSALYPSKRIIYISFKFMSFYTSNKSKNITKIIIPLDIFNFFVKKILKIFFSFFINSKNKLALSDEKNTSTNKNSKNFDKQKIALFMHKGIFYGHPSLFEKSLYYSDNINSKLNKYNLLHIDYSDYSSPDENINWVCINTIDVLKRKIFFKTFLFSLKTIYLIRNWSTLLGWLLCIRVYKSYVKYFELIKKFKNLEIALIDYDVLCPKTLILALENNNIKTFATQERFVHAFYTSTSNANVIVDTYYTASTYASDVIKKSKYYQINDVITVGQYRSDRLSFYKRQSAPKEISKAKANGKKILIALGFHSPKNWFESHTDLILNWTAQIAFLDDIIKLSQNLENIFIVLRYKDLDWIKNEHFKKTIEKIHHHENIILSNNYEESYYSYKLCAHADLIIAKATSLADECLSKEIPVLFHEYTHNMKKIFLDVPNYVPSDLVCHTFEELYQKSRSVLYSDSNKLRNAVKKMNQEIYYVSGREDIKTKIIKDLEKRLI